MLNRRTLKDEPTITSTSAVHNDGIKTRSQLLVSSYDLKTEEEDWSSLSGMRFVDHEEMMKMLNIVIKAHTKEFKYCKNPEILAHRQVKWGVCWKYTLRCKNCTYMSPVIKLYKEVDTNKPGTNPGAPNVAVAAVLHDCPIGSTKFQELFARMNCPPPSRTSMQRMSHNVGKELVKLNRTDMSEKLEIVKSVNRERGLPENVINVTVDGRYNSQTITSRKKPGLNATQAFTLAIETMTERKYIVASFAQNQMCWKGAWLRGKGFDVNCPNGHEDCTANLYRAAPVSEYQMGKEIGSQLALQDILVKNATTDGDGRAAKGIDDATRALHPMWKVERLADYVHLGQSQFRASLRAQFSEGMFYGRTKEIKKEMKKAFSQDVKCRSSMIVGQLMEQYKRNTDDVCKDLPKALQATIRNNNMPGTSAKQKCEHLGVNLSDSSLKFLDSMDKQFTYKQEYEKKPEVKRRRLTQSGEKILEHREAKVKSKERDVYRKGQLDPVPALLSHSTYCKRKLPPAP
ncbi:unnamed protein product [Mytilus coruscus]|uniref:Mutator-like transposase domain-containing protein n=1 Tax=Mytilus coruscus TaxID=42192 RepID=A0A6J8C3X4_MYTCO|nr:unnamed protein product [Mytilus coruscus]